jgi:hypothetical protein
LKPFSRRSILLALSLPLSGCGAASRPAVHAPVVPAPVVPPCTSAEHAYHDGSVKREWIQRDGEGHVVLWLQRGTMRYGETESYYRYHWKKGMLTSVDAEVGKERTTTTLLHGPYGELTAAVTPGRRPDTVTFAWSGTFSAAPPMMERRPDRPFAQPRVDGNLPRSLAEVATAWSAPLRFVGEVHVTSSALGDFVSGRYDERGLLVAEDLRMPMLGPEQHAHVYDDAGRLIESRWGDEVTHVEMEKGRPVRIVRGEGSASTVTNELEYTEGGRLLREIEHTSEGYSTLTTYGEACPPDDPSEEP